MITRRSVEKIIAAVCAAVILTACSADSAADVSDTLIEANAPDMVINVTTDYDVLLPEAGEAAQLNTGESGSIYIDSSAESKNSGATEEEETVLPADLITNGDIRDALTDEDKEHRTYSLIYFNKPTVTGEELKIYASVNTDEVAARMAEFADLFTPSRMRS